MSAWSPATPLRTAEDWKISRAPSGDHRAEKPLTPIQRWLLPSELISQISLR
jgi:hypothetical protein